MIVLRYHRPRTWNYTQHPAFEAVQPEQSYPVCAPPTLLWWHPCFCELFLFVPTVASWCLCDGRVGSQWATCCALCTKPTYIQSAIFIRNYFEWVTLELLKFLFETHTHHSLWRSSKSFLRNSLTLHDLPTKFCIRSSKVAVSRNSSKPIRRTGEAYVEKLLFKGWKWKLSWAKRVASLIAGVEMENREWLLYVEEINRLPKTTFGRTIWRFNFRTLQTLMAKNISYSISFIFISCGLM